MTVYEKYKEKNPHMTRSDIISALSQNICGASCPEPLERYCQDNKHGHYSECKDIIKGWLETIWE